MKSSLVVLLILLPFLIACGQKSYQVAESVAERELASLNGQSLESLNHFDEQALEKQFLLTDTQYLTKALRRASLVLVGRIPSQQEVDNLVAKQHAGYLENIEKYLLSNEFKVQMNNFHLELFEMGGMAAGINFNEAANLANYLLHNELDHREILTANYCINDSLQKVPCSAFANQTQQDQFAAGVLTTRGFLAKWDGPFYFKRVKRMQETFTCKSFPLDNDEGLDFSEISGSLKPFNSPDETPMCYSCHRTMNPRASLFFSFDRTGKYNLNPNVNPTAGEIVVTDTNVAATNNMLLTTSAQVRIYEKQVATLKEAAKILSSTSDFRDCLAQRYTNFILGQNASSQLPKELNFLREGVDHRNFKIKDLMIDILKSKKFIEAQ